MDARRLGWAGLALGCGWQRRARWRRRQADANGGHFRLGEQRLDAKYAIAVVRDEGKDDLGPQTLVYLSDTPLDAATAAAAFDPDDAVRAQMDANSGQIRAAVHRCRWHRMRPVLFPGRVQFRRLRQAGCWPPTMPVTSPAAGCSRSRRASSTRPTISTCTSMSPSPSHPARTCQRMAGTRARRTGPMSLHWSQGDLPALRQLTDPDHGYRFPQDDETQAKESLKSARDGEP